MTRLTLIPLRWSNKMNIKPIHNAADYKAALKAVAPYFENEPKPGSAEGDFFSRSCLC